MNFLATHILVLSVMFYGRFSTKKCGKIPLCSGEEENKLRSEIACTKHAEIITATSPAILSLLTVGKSLYKAGESLEKMQQITEAAVSAMVLANFLSVRCLRKGRGSGASTDNAYCFLMTCPRALFSPSIVDIV